MFRRYIWGGQCQRISVLEFERRFPAYFSKWQYYWHRRACTLAQSILASGFWYLETVIYFRLVVLDELVEAYFENEEETKRFENETTTVEVLSDESYNPVCKERLIQSLSDTSSSLAKTERDVFIQLLCFHKIVSTLSLSSDAVLIEAMMQSKKHRKAAENGGT